MVLGLIKCCSCRLGERSQIVESLGPNLVGEGEGLGGAAGVDEDYGALESTLPARISAIRADMDLPA